MTRTLSVLASDPSHLPLLTVFKESGVTQKYGFEIEIDVVGGAKAPTMAHRPRLLLAGEVDFVSGVHHETYKARARGEKRFVYLAQTQNRWDDRLMVSPEITSIQDLRGKRILCHLKVSCISGNLTAILESCGLNSDEFEIYPIESMSGNLQSYVDRVVAGEAHGTLVDMPFDLYGQKKGLKILALPERPVIHNTTILATTDYIRDNKDTVNAFLKALIEAIHFFKTRPTEVVGILRKNLAQRYGLDDEEYYVHLQREWAKLLMRKPYPLAGAIQNVFDLDAAKDSKVQEEIGPMEPWDLHYLRRIDDSGFIDKLYTA
ncbi:MAG: ABC transporter substrate-binding protein [Deltaproteobacteria bacterium]|nr:ABC transporter substrate-binding protein [Deltaproteobacteria bacterium]